MRSSHPVCQAGCTTLSGVIKPHLESFQLFSHHPKADLQKIVDIDTVKVVPDALANDGTVLKPGLEFDRRQKLVIGLVHNVDAEFVRKHPIPDPGAIKKNLIINADISYATAQDNGASMPVAIHYRPKSVSSEKMLSSMKNSALTIQTCERCLKRKQREAYCDKRNVRLYQSLRRLFHFRICVFCM